MSEIIEILDKVFSKAAKIGENVAVFASKKLSRQVRFSVNKIDVSSEWHEYELNVLVEKDRKTQIFSISFQGLEQLDDILKKVEAALKLSPPKPYEAPLPEPSEKYPSIPDAFDEETLKDPSRLIKIANEAIDSALREGVKKVAGAVYSNAYWIGLKTTAGFEMTHSFTNNYLDVRVFHGPLETGHASMASRRLRNIDPWKVGETAAYYANLARNPKKFKAGEYSAVFSPDAVASILNFAGLMASAFAVIAGYSAFSQKLGQKVASEKFTLSDNPLVTDSFNPLIFDMEGVPTRNNVIIENGILKAYLHNRITAKLLNAEHTGNAGWVFPNPWNLVVGRGDMKFEEMISELGNGLIVGNVTYIRFQDYVKGEFSGVIRDGVILVKNGEPMHGVIGLRLSDNILRWLDNIRGVGKDQVQLYHWWLEMHTPVVSTYLLVDKARFTEAW
ncbi:MAG: TldD/PmbA family protein [Crenarchaeota archaeon]|nr:TldD/PmbA family protein [Thermoproteota archaeon]MCR8473200.1 TldD/PmbA family protein [Thermoproteota archaeon]